MTMREKLDIANACNPKMRSIIGFQSPFTADIQSLEIITQGSATADAFDMVYDNGTISVYRIFNQLDSGPVKSFDVKYIAERAARDRWIVCQGLICVSDVCHVAAQERHAKKLLIAAIKREWGVTLKRMTAREKAEEATPSHNQIAGRWVIRPP